MALDAVGAHPMVQHLLPHRRLFRVAGRVRRSGGSGGTFGGGSGGLIPRMLPMIHLPRVTGDVLLGLGGRHQERALADQAPAHVHVAGRA